MTEAGIHIVVRHVGERTLELCRDILKRQSDASVELISATPFSETVRLGFEAGLRAGKKWTLFLDADVVPTEDCVQRLFDVAESGKETLFEAQGLIVDKVFGVRRPAGNHIYRTAFFEEALTLLPQNAGSLRPESDTLWSMVRAGYSWYQSDVLVGLHDYGQSYADIARKVMVQYHKFPEKRDLMLARFQEQAKKDADFAVALAACRKADRFASAPQVDARQLRDLAAEVLHELHLDEKPPITTNERDQLASYAREHRDTPLDENEKTYIGLIGYHG